MATFTKEDVRQYVELNLRSDEDLDAIATLCEALGNRTRLDILRQMQKPPHINTVPQLSKALGIPTTTLMYHLDKMINANLLALTYKASKSGAVRILARKLQSANLSFFYNDETPVSLQSETQSARVGQFIEFEGGSFNFCTADKHFTSFGDNCYMPERFEAELIYTTGGQITYRFSNQAAKLHSIMRVELSLEICSEAPYFDNDYLSDITFWINGKELTTYTCPGDFGDHRGRLNPEWWSDSNTQYGTLLTVAVDESGVTVNGERVFSKVKLSDLALDKGNKLEVRFGNKTTARNVGGFNLFGRTFGDHPQDINLTYYYEKIEQP